MTNFEKIGKKWITILFLTGIAAGAAKFGQSAECLPPLSINCPLSDHRLTSSVPGFSISPITDHVFSRINGISYREGCPIPLADLRYLTVLHKGFDGNAHQGELIVHKEIAEPVLEIFMELYQTGYPIERICLIDDYGGDDAASMSDNNTSAFCCRTIAGTDHLSLHSYGLAIDINPLYNPYVDGEIISPAAAPYDPTAGVVYSPYFMTETDDCVRLFRSHGFTWGGSWTSPTDYQHFEFPLQQLR